MSRRSNSVLLRRNTNNTIKGNRNFRKRILYPTKTVSQNNTNKLYCIPTVFYWYSHSMERTRSFSVIYWDEINWGSPNRYVCYFVRHALGNAWWTENKKRSPAEHFNRISRLIRSTKSPEKSLFSTIRLRTCDWKKWILPNKIFPEEVDRRKWHRFS